MEWLKEHTIEILGILIPSLFSWYSIVVDKLKAPATLEIKNLSNENVSLISELNMPKNIIANSQLNYRLPKKSRLILENQNPDSVSIHLHYSSNKPIIINHKELR